MKRLLFFMERLFLPSLLSLLATLAVLHAEPFPIDFVTVGDTNNVADSTTKLGAVGAPYQIGKYEVTVAQWCGFLNAVASKADPHGLYNPNMASDPKIACIEKTTNNNGTFTYTPLPNTEQLPITYVCYNSTLHFCNWYQNGMPTDLQGGDVVAASTEDGAYTFTQLTDGTEQAVLSSNAVYTLATEDQWMKAAYYAGNGINSSYYLYPTKHNNPPNIGATDVSNEANWDTTSYASFWTGLEARKNLVLTPVDFYAQTMSAYQACDMGGNVNEWMMRSNEVDPATPLPITRGGSWASTYYAPNHWAHTINDLMRTAPAETYASNPSVITEGNNQIGFRLVCSIVPPEPMVAGLGGSSASGSASSRNTSLQQTSNQAASGGWWSGLRWYEKAGVVVGGFIVVGVGAWYCLPLLVAAGGDGAAPTAVSIIIGNEPPTVEGVALNAEETLPVDWMNREFQEGFQTAEQLLNQAQRMNVRLGGTGGFSEGTVP